MSSASLWSKTIVTLILYLLTAAALLGIAHACVTRLTRGVALVLLLLPLVFTGRALLTGRVYAPVELAYTTEPLASCAGEIDAPPPQNRMLSDITFQMIPWRQALRQSIAHGQWPLWNRFEGCGDVLAGAAQSAPFSPFTLLALLLPVAASFGFTASIAFFLAALGTYLLARELGCGETASLIAAAIFTFSAPIALQILWPLGFGWALLPFVLMATRRVVASPSIRSTAILMTALTLEALAGHPETLLHVAAIGAVYGVFALVRARQKSKAMACAIAAGVLAVMLSAIAILPFLDASRQTVEHRIRTELFARSPLRVAAGLPTAALLSDLLPFARRSFRPFLMARAEAGSIAFALAIFALAGSRARERWFFAVLGVVCLLASANAWPVAQWLHRLPLFSLALNDRLASAVPLCAAILAAFAVDALSDRAGTVMAGLLILIAAGAMGMRAGSIDMPRLVAELAPLAIATVIVLFARNRALVAPVLLALILLQRAISDGALIPANDARIAYPPVALFRPLQSIREPFRITGIGPSLFPNTATMYGLEDARVMTAMTLTAFDETFPLWCRHGGFGFNQVDDLTRPMLSMLNIRFAIVPKDEAIPGGWRDVTTGHNSRLIENEHALPRAFIPRNVRLGAANEIEDMAAATDFAETAWLEMPGTPRDIPNGPGTIVINPNALDVTMANDGYIVISHAAWTGWRAYLDGRRTRIIHANHAFLGVFVPKGRHAVRLVYLPRSFVVGRAITFITLAFVIALGVAPPARRLYRRRLGGAPHDDRIPRVCGGEDMKLKVLSSLLVVAGVAGAVVLHSQETPKPRPAETQAAYEPSRKTGAGQLLLAQFAGDWDVVKTFFPSSGAAPIKTTGTCKQWMIHDGHFLQSDFTFNERDGGKTTGTGISGFDPKTNRFTTVWYDSHQTTMSIRQSDGTFDGKEIVLWATSLDPDRPGRKTVARAHLEENGRVLLHRHFLVEEGGKEKMMIELRMTRKGAPAK